MKSNNKFWLPVLAARAYIGALALALALTAGFASCDTGTGTSGDDDLDPGGGENSIGGEVTWTAVKTSFGNIWAIAYGGGKFVAVGSAVINSSDGVSWAESPTNFYPNTTGIFSVAYGADKFVLGGDHGYAAYSYDGVNWNDVTDSGFSTSRDSTIACIVFDNDKFVAVGAYGQVAYSSDGIKWTAVTGTTFDDSYSNGAYTLKDTINGIAYGAGKFVAVGTRGKAAFCTDPSSEWTAVTNTTFDDSYSISGFNYTYSDFINSIAYGAGKFVAVGAGGPALTKVGGKAAYSSDGIIWTAVTDTTFGSRNILGIAYGAGKFVAVGTYGKAAASSDGVAWTAIKDTTFGDSGLSAINGIAYGAGKFVAVGNDGEIAYWITR